MTIVPDTNVIVSAQLNPHGNEAQLLTHWQRKQVDFALSEAILGEYRRVLAYKHIQERLSRVDLDAEQLVRELKEGSDSFPGTTPVDPIKDDPSDEKFLACAVEANADAIVTGDTKHLLPLKSFRSIPIITAKECIARISQRAA